MDGLIDMAKSESAAETTPLMPQENKYPYGLQITLDTESLQKLGVDHSDWEIGDVFPLDILAKVVSKSANESENGGNYCSVSLQITHIGAEEAEESSSEAYSRNEEKGPDLGKHGYLRYQGG